MCTSAALCKRIKQLTGPHFATHYYRHICAHEFTLCTPPRHYHDFCNPMQVPPPSVEAWRQIYPRHKSTKGTAIAAMPMALYVWHDSGCLRQHISDRSRRGKQQCRSRLNGHLSRDCSKRLRCRATVRTQAIQLYARDVFSSLQCMLIHSETSYGRSRTRCLESVSINHTGMSLVNPKM